MHRSLINRYSSISVLIPVALLTALACAASKDARPSPTGEVISPEGSATAASSTTGPTSVVSSPAAPASPTAGGRTASSTATGKDSAAKDPPISVPTIKGRTKKDSIALVKAVKAGMNNTAWPVKTAPQLPGAILPAHRIVAFYGNPLSKKMGVLGELPPD